MRVRPPDPNLDGGLYHAHCLNVTSATSIGMQSRPEKVFTFDHVAGMDTTQVYTCTSTRATICKKWAVLYSGTDTIGQEDSVQNSYSRGWKSTQTRYLGRKKVSCLDRCPYRGVPLYLLSSLHTNYLCSKHPRKLCMMCYRI